MYLTLWKTFLFPKIFTFFICQQYTSFSFIQDYHHKDNLVTVQIAQINQIFKNVGVFLSSGFTNQGYKKGASYRLSEISRRYQDLISNYSLTIQHIIANLFSLLHKMFNSTLGWLHIYLFYKSRPKSTWPVWKRWLALNLCLTHRSTLKKLYHVSNTVTNLIFKFILDSVILLFSTYSDNIDNFSFIFITFTLKKMDDNVFLIKAVPHHFLHPRYYLSKWSTQDITYTNDRQPSTWTISISSVIGRQLCLMLYFGKYQ